MKKTDLFVEAGYQGLGDVTWDSTCPSGNTYSDLNADGFGGIIAKAGFRYRL
tara:strand:- start:368 stop:523 length:156 start_codon:yes stop_codon:yes gene_type:complete